MTPLQPIPLVDAEAVLDPCWLEAAEATRLFAALLAEVAWATHHVRLFGRELPSPRLSCWIGDAGAMYRYSGVSHAPHPWPECLLPVRERLQREAGVRFNSVLANLYRDGRDSMGWHSDDEPELGSCPTIASLSLGGTRRFVFRHRRDASIRHALELPHGSLLVMRGDTQANYRHALPKTARPVAARINLTFRRIGQ